MACTNDKRRLQRDAKPVENTLIDGLTFVLAPKNRSHVLKTIMEHLKISDRSLAEEGYTALLRDFEPKPYPSIEGLRNLQRPMQLQNPAARPHQAGRAYRHIVDPQLGRERFYRPAKQELQGKINADTEASP